MITEFTSWKSIADFYRAAQPTNHLDCQQKLDFRPMEQSLLICRASF